MKSTPTQELIHSVHIPVMGTSFTIDTPLRVAKYGISSVMSIGDDELCETMRDYHAKANDLPFEPIKKWSEDFRAKRITAYLDLVDHLIKTQFEALKATAFEPGSEITKYFEMLPTTSPLHTDYLAMLAEKDEAKKQALQTHLRNRMRPGKADVNIMTKIDRTNYDKQGNLLPEEFSDALSALRGFANSTLESGIVFSAGFNRRLYAYIETFDPFFPDETGHIKKHIILKVSDFRSSATQGRFLAKKGIWVSEHRIESGLNCGGHAFASDGYLLGPILEEFKTEKETLFSELLVTCNEALAKRNRIPFKQLPKTNITVQGGIGTHTEDQFLIQHYRVDGTGWATPFLLVPEVTTLDEETRQLLSKATQEDLYLSDISPLGVPFNTVRFSISEQEKLKKAEAGKPGSPCPKGHLVSNTEFTTTPICTASTLYQRKKIEQLKHLHLPQNQYQIAFNAVIAKACLCEDLAASALISHHLNNKRALSPAVCPGPNLAYFSTICSLAEMMGHIYGRQNLLNNTARPNMFMAELKMYINYFAKEIQKSLPDPNEKRIQYLNTFHKNLLDGIAYYQTLIPNLNLETPQAQAAAKAELKALEQELEAMVKAHQGVFAACSTLN
ncbi:MAG: hypothetical protein AB7F28_07600 [Candidatus Margulisiibacteriota bacterium]